MSERFFVTLVDGTVISTCEAIKGFQAEKETGLTYLYNRIGNVIGAVKTDRILGIILQEENAVED